MPELHERNSGTNVTDAPLVPPGPLTEAEFFAWCNEEMRAEWVDGEVVIMSPEIIHHNLLALFLIGVLQDFVFLGDLGQVLGLNVMIRLGAQRALRVPDLFFVCKERLGQMRTNHFEGAPDLVMEIVSPESIARDKREKYQDYEAAGVREYWVIDPLEQNMETFALGVGGSLGPIPERDGRIESAVLPGFFLKPSWLWQKTPPATREALREMGLSR
jgi:Uma2 family endonuclease